MSHLYKLHDSEAFLLWNNFTATLPDPPPFSFNPSLFYFFQNHFNWKPYYFLLFANDNPVGLLPLVNTGKAWVSLPHFSYGGMLTKEKNSLPGTIRLIKTIIGEIQKQKTGSGFYHYGIEKQFISQGKTHSKLFVRTLACDNDFSLEKQEKITSFMKLEKDKESMLKKLNTNLRRKLNRAIKNRPECKIGGAELLNDFYQVYSKNIYYLKSLNYGKRFFDDLLAAYQFGRIKMFVVYLKNKPVGSALLASYQGFYENLYFATIPEFRKYYIADWLHWQMINFAIRENALFPRKYNSENSIYSFGRSTAHSSVHQYKRHWPVKDFPVFYFTGFPDVRKNKGMQKIWGLLPFSVTKLLGTFLVKHIY